MTKKVKNSAEKLAKINFRLHAIVRNLFPIFCAILISGCAMPMPFQIASWALDGISYIATDKSVTDHGISIVAQKDCALLRVVQGQELCSTNDGSDKHGDLPHRWTGPSEGMARILRNIQIARDSHGHTFI